MRKLFGYSWLIKRTAQHYLPRLYGSATGPTSKRFDQFNRVWLGKVKKTKKTKKNTAFHFFSQFLHPPSHRHSCCVPAPLTWSSSSTPTLSWEMAPLSGRRLSTAPASLRGQRCMESTWSRISCGTWIQTRSTTSACCWLGPERGELARRDRRLWAGPSVQVSAGGVTRCTTGQRVNSRFKIRCL